MTQSKDRSAMLRGFEQLNIQITDEQLTKIDKYVNLLQKWNTTYNFVAKSTENEFFSRHILDCAQLAPLILPVNKVLDIGSGAGLPAIVLAIITGAEIFACEINSKKANFLKTARRELELQNNLQVINQDIATLDDLENQFDIITSRAFAEANDIIKLSNTYLKPSGKFLLLKGKTAKEELKNINFQMTVSLKPSITNPEAHILILSPVSRETK